MDGADSVVSVDVEDWFHILDSPGTPDLAVWESLEDRVETNLQRMLDLFSQTGVRVTLFWLGWVAQRHPDLVRRCRQAGHEIASHGYAHLLAYQVGPRAFRQDVERARKLLEDILSEPVMGFRTAGFGITAQSLWALEEVRAAGHRYDSSIFPAPRGHGGMPESVLGPHLISTPAGELLEWPMPVVEALGRRVNLFGGGYLRISPRWLIRWGLGRLRRSGQPLVVYVHPREVDPHHPRLKLGLGRRIKSYIGLSSTMPKLRWLCESGRFATMGELSAHFLAERPETSKERIAWESRGNCC